MSSEFKVETCRESGRVFVAAQNKQVEILINDLGIEVQITSGNEVLAECGVEND